MRLRDRVHGIDRVSPLETAQNALRLRLGWSNPRARNNGDASAGAGEFHETWDEYVLCCGHNAHPVLRWFFEVTLEAVSLD